MPDYDTYAAARLPALRRSAFLLCGDWDRGDDLVQKVLTELYVRWSRASTADNLEAYVQTMLVRRYLDERRTGWARWVRLTDNTRQFDLVEANEPDPATRVDVRAALACLPPRQRAVIVLRYFEDLSVEQAAEVLRCSPGTVKSNTFRAMEALRAWFGAQRLSERSS